MPAFSVKNVNLSTKKILAFSFIVLTGITFLTGAYIFMSSEEESLDAELPSLPQKPQVSVQKSSPVMEQPHVGSIKTKGKEEYENPFLNEYLKKLLKQAIEEIVREEREKLKAEIEKLKRTNPIKAVKSVKNLQVKEKKSSYPKKEVKIPDVITVKRVFGDDGKKLLYTEEFGVIFQGRKIKGWKVVKIEEGHIVLRRGNKEKVVKYLISFDEGGKKDESFGKTVSSGFTF